MKRPTTMALRLATPRSTRALGRFMSSKPGGPVAPTDTPPKPGGYFARLARPDASGSFQRKTPASYGYNGDPIMDLPETAVATRGIGSFYDPSELNWVDQDASEPWIDYRDKGAAITCKGKLQRRGFYKSTCQLIDLDDLHFTNLKLLEYFVTDSGSIKPAKQTGLCTKCQRRMAKTVKRARQMAMIPIVEGWSTQDFTENIEDLSRGGRHDRTI